MRNPKIIGWQHLRERRATFVNMPQVISIVFFTLFSFCLTNSVFAMEEGDEDWHSFVSPYRKWANMENYKMHYIDSEKGEPVVMVHGFSDSTYCWHKNAHKLIDEGFRVILIDQPGMGKSDIPPEPYVYSIENQSQAIIKLTEELDLNKFHLMGHSMGGGIALYLSYIIPERILSTVVINPGCFQPPRRLALTYPGASHFASIFGGKWMFKMALKQVYYDEKKVTNKLVNEYARVLEKPGYWNMLSSLSKQFFSDEFSRMVRNYDSINTPLLIIWGVQDRWLPVEYGQRLHEKISTSQLIKLDNGGHNSHQECDTMTNDEVLKFYHKHEFIKK